MASYITNSEADTYFTNNRFNVDDWDNASETQKTRALAEATLRIDQLNFVGSKASSSQTNEFPRGDDTTVPDDIKYACAEIAYELIKGADPDSALEEVDIVKHKFGDVEATFDKGSNLPSQHILAGIPSVLAWRFLKPYLQDISVIRFERSN